MKPTDVLKQYWGYEAFRPLQEPIIQHVTDGHDAIALLPTGGGKSICFQVPGLIREGLTIVISPLIALMQDQVQQLEARGIGALAITSAMKEQEIDAAFDRCIYQDDIQFLYLSPERLATRMAEVRIKKMKLALIAVDEAHCISEWGYDFRPSYLNIAKLREWQPEVPVIALTASATKQAVKDIEQRLELKKGKKLFFSSFQRSNLAYFIHWEEDKLGIIERIAEKQGGSGIIYTRSRLGTERISNALNKRGFTCDFYHAGLSNDERMEKQERWTSGAMPVIAATNAFGMGIDKPDVRFVIHLDIPDTLENYYQEAGRAGRDGKKAYGICLLTKSDLNRFHEKHQQAFPSKADIKKSYDLICDALQLAVGSGKDERHYIDLEQICLHHEVSPFVMEQSLRFLEREGYLFFQVKDLARSTLRFTAGHEAVRNLRSKDHKLDRVIEALLRSYPRLFEESVKISEWTLSIRAQCAKQQVIDTLKWMNETGYVEYHASQRLPSITFVHERVHTKNLSISHEHYTLRKKVHDEKYSSMLAYIENDSLCRSRALSAYFGELDTTDCGICDVCIEQKD
jgi:ATP-dependent DNA helicase RecQ